MSLGFTQKKTFLNIKEGKVYRGDTPYDYVEGRVAGIALKERDFRGEVVRYWYLDLQSATGELYSLGIPYSSGVALSLFNSLASATDLSQEVRIEPYSSGEYTRVSTYSAGERLDWKYPQIPPTTEVLIGDTVHRDSSERLSLVEKLVTEIKERLI